jgi:[ribosomal protein S18]-alanine N-acetyltransferase
VTVTLEPMRWWDLADVVAAEHEVFAGQDPWSAEQFWAELAGVPVSRHYLVARDGPVLGYAGLAIGPDSADVMTLAVVPASRRRGLASRLLEAMLGEAVRRRVTEVLLEVRADNDPALELYRRLGFEQVARRRGYYRDADGLVLRVRLGRAGSP